ASETLGSGGRYSRRACKPGQRTSCIARLASDTTRGPDDLAELINPGEEVLCGLELVHDGSISSKPQRQGCRYDSFKEFRKGKTIADALPLRRFCGTRWPCDAVSLARCWMFASRGVP